MEHDFGAEQEHRRNLVAYNLGGMEVAGVESDNLIVLGTVAHIEIVAAHGERLKPDTENLRFQAVLHMGVFLLVDFIERVLEDGTVEHTVHSHLLLPVVNPKVHDTLVIELTSHLVGDSTATLCVVNPEITDAFIGIAQCEAARFGM